MADLQTIGKTHEGLARLGNQFDKIQKGENLLVVVNGNYSLMKYDGHESDVEGFHTHRYGRHGRISSALSELLPMSKEKRQALEERKQREHKRHKGNIYGSHRLDFSFDEEFNIFLPSSSMSSDIYLVLAHESIDGKVSPVRQTVDIFVGDDLVAAEMRKVARPNYFESVVVPFIEGRATQFDMPGYRRKGWFGKKGGRWSAQRSFAEKIQGLKYGNFVYVGCKEEVYLLGLATDKKGLCYMQGTYTTSTKPIFYFSNNYLGFISRYDAEKPKAPKSMKSVNVAEYRTYDIPGFKGQPFIFPQMGRSQDCKNTIFTGKPEVITSDVNEALKHFTTTDFAEFSDVVEKYAEQVSIIHPSSEKPNGKFYY